MLTPVMTQENTDEHNTSSSAECCTGEGGFTIASVAHNWWSILTGSYFPGFYTALVYWIIGPWVLSRMLGSRREALIAVALFAAVLIPMLTVFAQP